MPERLIAEVADLRKSVGDLATHVSISQSQTKKTQRLTIGAVVLGSLSILLTITAIIGGVVAWDLNRDTRDAVEKVEQVQITTCKNANASRRVHHDFWIYLLDVSRQNPDNQIPVVQEFFDDFQMVVDEAFGERSCAIEDLNKKHPLPQFPRIPTQREIEESAR